MKASHTNAQDPDRRKMHKDIQDKRHAQKRILSYFRSCHECKEQGALQAPLADATLQSKSKNKNKPESHR